MDKRVLINEIRPKLNEMGLTYRLGEGADVTIACDFLDTGWGTGNKKINYVSSVYFDETKNTVYMWELTKETGSGFSFGGDNEAFLQSGKTLFRKVKSIHYGPDGKAYEFTLDLGSIPKAFKVTAEAYGWKFKTVLKRDRASFPSGYAAANAGTGLQQQYLEAPPINLNMYRDRTYASFPPAIPEAAGQAYYQQGQNYVNLNDIFYPGGKRSKTGIKGVFYWIGYLLLVLFTAVMFTYSKNSLVGWSLAAGLLLMMLVLHKTFIRKVIVVWLAAAAILFLIYAFTM